MPKIPDYQSNTSAQIPYHGVTGRNAQPSDIGGPGIEALGQGLQQAGSRLAEAQRLINHRKTAAEITRVDMEMAQAEGELALSLQKQAKEWTPDKGNISEGFQAHAQQRVESVAYDKDGNHLLETPEAFRHWQLKQAKTREHFTLASMQAESQIQGQHAVNQHLQHVDTLANNVQAVPEMYGMMREQMETTVDNPNGFYAALPAVKREELKRGAVNALARAAVQGSIRLRPTQALADLQAGGSGTWHKDDLTDADYNNLLNQAKTATHALGVDKDRAYTEAERQRRELARTTTTKLLTKLAAHDYDPTSPPLTAQDIIDSGIGNYDDNGMQSLIGIVHARSKETDGHKIRTDSTVYRNLFNDIHRPDGDPKKITDPTILQDAFGKRGKLSFDDMNDLRRELFESKTPDGVKLSTDKKETLDLLKTQITKSNMLMGKIDQDGDLNMMRFTKYVDRQIQAYKAAKKDPHDLFDDSKPDFIGKPEVLKKFQTTMQESLAKFSNKMREEKNARPALKPEELRKEGESYSEWKKRTIP